MSTVGDDLSTEVCPDGSVIVTDGQRSPVYGPTDGKPLEGEKIHIVASYVEAGWFSEANVIKLSDGHRAATYIPIRIVGTTIQ